MKISKMSIDGNGNIGVKDIINSTVVIRQGSKKLEKWMHEIHEWTFNHPPSFLNLIVVTTSIDRMQSIKSIDAKTKKALSKYYGNTPEEWRPFDQNETITDLIKEFHAKSSFKLEVYFIDDLRIDNKEFLTSLEEDISPRAILVVDCLSLEFDENKLFAQVFNKSNIGGCIIPFNQECDNQIVDNLKKKREDVFYRLQELYYNKFNKQYLYLDMDVNSKEVFYRRLTDISIKHLEIPEPRKTGSWASSYSKNKGLLKQKVGFS